MGTTLTWPPLRIAAGFIGLPSVLVAMACVRSLNLFPASSRQRLSLSHQAAPPKRDLALATLSRNLHRVPAARISVRGPRRASDYEGSRPSHRRPSLLPTDDVPDWRGPSTMANDSLNEARHVTTASSDALRARRMLSVMRMSRSWVFP